ncbi:hypothetical protein [Lentibacillus sediminis]|uniref:hypothetical protein n=1 Tax=Lentibacillus sediminis TaxID=1940529 RepID=UPI000C1C21A2|nr:hypothetical protein [Lentibacillus sediminis]
MMAFMPIIIVLTVFVLIYFAASKIGKYTYFYRKGAAWAIICYFAVLVLSPVVFLFLPIDRATESAEGNQYTVEPTLNQLISDGRKDEINPDYLRNQWTFPLEQEELQITAPGNDVNGIPIMVKRTDELSQEVEVLFYQTPIFINGERITEHIREPRVQSEEGRLTVIKPETVELDFTSFRLEMPYRQFSGSGNEDTRDPYNPSGGLGSGNVLHVETTILVRVPEQLELDMGTYVNMIVSPE